DWGVFSIGVLPVVYVRSGSARSADPAGGGAVHPEAHAQPVGRGAVRALAGETLLPVLLRRAELLPRIAVQPFVSDALAPTAGRGPAGGADPRKPRGGIQNRTRARSLNLGRVMIDYHGAAQARPKGASRSIPMPDAGSMALPHEHLHAVDTNGSHRWFVA